jgi:hypothetical protein
MHVSLYYLFFQNRTCPACSPQGQSLAESQHHAALAAKIASRLRLYQAGKPCRD